MNSTLLDPPQALQSLRPLLICIAWIALPSASVADDTARVICKDGTTLPHGGRGACTRHGGIDEAANAAAAQGTDNTPPPTTGSNPTPTLDSKSGTTVPAHIHTPAAISPTRPPDTPPRSAAPTSPNRAPTHGDGVGKVWVNTATRVYHCPSDPSYGMTGHGEYMTEADAKAKGNHADHNKPCT